jgi:hypothetical protein
MAWNDNSGYFDRDEKRQMQSAALIPIGIFAFAIGVSVGVWGVWVFGLVCVAVGGLDAYKRISARKRAKQIARDEAEIRAHHLRQARGGH